MMFEHSDSKGVLFTDEDYEDSNKKYNRVKSYSFSRGKIMQWTGIVFNTDLGLVNIKWNNFTLFIYDESEYKLIILNLNFVLFC